LPVRRLTVRPVGYKTLVIDDETMQSVRELRARGLSPKEIARSLGLRPAAVADLVRKAAAERDTANPDAYLVGCWVNAGWSTDLSIAGRPWTGPSAITFGRDGKPTYIEGPHDDPSHILRTLRRAVGHNGFHYTVAADIDELPMTG
jgi:hypothetical protein